MTDQTLWYAMHDHLSGIGELHHVDQTKDGTISDIADRAIETAPDKFHIIGFSFGSFVAREICLKAPERILSLILINTSARNDDELARSRKEHRIVQVQKTGFHGFSKRALTRSINPNNSKADQIITVLGSMAVRIGHDAFIQQTAIRRDDAHRTLNRITCPTLVIWSRHGRLRSEEEALELVDGIPNSAYRIIEDSGHMLPLERPKQLSGVIKTWLNGH